MKEWLRRNLFTGGMPTITAGLLAGTATAGVVALTGINVPVQQALRLDWWQLSVLLMAPELALIPGQRLVGHLRFDRRRLIAAQCGLSAVLMLCMAVAVAAESYAWLLVFTAANSFILPIEPIARALNTAHVNRATRGMSDAERKRRRDRQDGEFSTAWFFALELLQRGPIMIGAVWGLGVFAGLMALGAVLALRFLPRVGRPPETAAATGAVTGLSRSARRRLYAMLCLTGVAISVAMVGQPIILDAKQEPRSLYVAIGLICIVLSVWVFPRWGEAFGNPIARMRYALVAAMAAWLALVATAALDGPLWAAVFLVTGVVINLAANVVVNDALAITRASVPEDRLAQANGRLIAWRIAGIIPGRGLGPALAAAGLATTDAQRSHPAAALATGTQLATALAGLLLVALAGAAIWRWRGPETERAGWRKTVGKPFPLSFRAGDALRFGAGMNGERVVWVGKQEVPLPRGRCLKLYDDSNRPVALIFATLLQLWWQTVRKPESGSEWVVNRSTRHIDQIAAAGGISIRCLARASYELTWNGTEVTMDKLFGPSVTHGVIVDTEPIWTTVVRFVNRVAARFRDAVSEAPRTPLGTLTVACGGLTTVAAFGFALAGWSLTATALVAAAGCWWLGKAAEHRVSGSFVGTVRGRIRGALGCVALAGGAGVAAVVTLIVSGSMTADDVVALLLALALRGPAFRRLSENRELLARVKEAHHYYWGLLADEHLAAPEVVGTYDGGFKIVVTVAEREQPRILGMLRVRARLQRALAKVAFEVRAQPPPVGDRPLVQMGV